MATEPGWSRIAHTAAGPEDCLDRRAFLSTIAAGVLAAPLAAVAQPATRPPRIGWLTSSVVHARNVEAFRQAMQALGYSQISIEFRAAEGKTDRLPALAAELVALGVDVIVTDGGPAAVAAKQATVRTPVVVGAAAIDLVRQGVVASLARPGGNVTGLVLSTGSEPGSEPGDPAPSLLQRADQVIE